MYVRGERTISKRKEVYYETEECGNVLSETRTRLHYATKKLGYSTRRKRIVPLILHWFLFFDTDSTEKLRVHCQTERLRILGVHVCVLNCTVPDVKLWRERKSSCSCLHRTFTSLYLLCSCSDTQSECGSNEEE